MEAPKVAGARPEITVVGSVNMDLVVTVARHPQPGETLIGSDYATHPGGKGANQAVAAARLGGNVSFVGRVGQDGFGDELRTSLSNNGVNVTHLGVSPGPSGVAFIQVDERGQNSIVVSPGANHALSGVDLGEFDFSRTTALLLQLEVKLDVTLAAAREARRHGAVVVLNLAPAVDLKAEQLQDVTHLSVNEFEAGLLLGVPAQRVVEDAEASARELTSLVPQVVVTLGGRGAVWAQRAADGSLRSGAEPAFPVTVLDTTAAGDAFTGAFALKVAEDREMVGLREAVRFANAAGALATTKPGAQPSLPTLAEVARLLEELP